MKKRLVSIILVLSVLSSFIVVTPVSAAGFGSSSTAANVVVNKSAREYWDSKFDSWFSDVPIVGTALTAIQWKDMCWALMDTALPKYGEFDNLSSLTDYARQVWTRLNTTKLESINSYLNQVPDWDILRAPFKYLVGQLAACRPTTVSVEQFAGYGWCVSDGQGNMLCRSGGQIAYYKEPEQAEGEEATSLGGKWVDAAFRDGVPGLHLYSYRSTLETVADRLCDLGQTCAVQSWTYKDEKYWYILKERGSSVYADNRGRPYVVRQSSDYAVDKSQDYYEVNKDSGDTYNQQLVDLLTGILNAPQDNSVTQGDNSLYLEDGAIYDPDNRTYSFTATNSFNTTNNTYYTYNYSYTYHINYTSITYIGTTAEYDEIYEYYYELPDGRSSADLTADELLALNTEVDVVPYARSTDNTALRSLYHLDGNTRDDSYWSYCTDWEWKEGASITYMEAPSPFGGYLYLDETEHEWDMVLPSVVSSGDFTLQWRMYQKATVAPQQDSYIAFGSTQILKFDGGDFTFNSTAHLMPVGTWNEFALIREMGVLRLYLNGVLVDSRACADTFGNAVTWHFGSEQQTTKGLDEIRFVNYALVSGGASYDAATAPYDTNLSFTLPDSMIPVADEYWTFSSSKENILAQYNFDDWRNYQYSDKKAYLNTSSPSFNYSAGTWSGPVQHSKYDFPVWYTYGNLTSILSDGLSTSLVGRKVTEADGGTFVVPPYYFDYGTNYARLVPSGGIFTCLGYYDKSGKDYTYSLSEGTYTFSMVALDGSIGSITFTLPFALYDTDGSKSNYASVISFNGYQIGVRSLRMGYSSSDDSYFYLVVQPEDYDTYHPFVYLELVEGDSTDLSAEFVSAIAPVNSDFKTPTLAVRTDLDVTGYQIGGVRPSLPEKGLVYALVEDSRITSLQIYNGSMWEQVDGRIWTGSRWVPYYAYDILLFKDLWDIVEADPSQDYIYTESGFWSWLQKAWAQMIEILTSIRDKVSGSSGGSGDSVDSSDIGPDSTIVPSVDDDDGGTWSFIDLAKALKDGMWAITKGVVKTGFNGITGVVSSVGTIKDGFDAFDALKDPIGGMDAWDGSFDFQDVPLPDTSGDSSG